MHTACLHSRHSIATWLHVAGLADYLHIKNNHKETPMMLAFRAYFTSGDTAAIQLALWLCEHGAAHNNKTKILELERFPMHAQEHLLFLVERRIENYSALNTLLLSARIGNSSLTTQNGVTTTSLPNLRPRQHLKILNSFEPALFKIIATYADIPIGKQLSRLRDIHAALLSRT